LTVIQGKERIEMSIVPVEARWAASIFLDHELKILLGSLIFPDAKKSLL